MQVIAAGRAVPAAGGRPVGAAGERARGRGPAPGRAEAPRPFDLARGPLLRRRCCASRARTTCPADPAPHRQRRLVDGVLVRELAALYAAFAAGRPSPLPELPVQYADFAVWQRGWLRGEVLERRARLLAAAARRRRRRSWSCPPTARGPRCRATAAPPRPVRLPAGLVRQAARPSAGARARRCSWCCSPPSRPCSRATAGRTTSSVGTPVAGRTRVETEGLIGFFVNTLVLRGDLSGEPDLPRAARPGARDGARRLRAPGRAVREAGRGAAAGAQPRHTPLFQVMFALQNAPPGGRRSWTATAAGPARGDDGEGEFELTLSRGEAACCGELEYATDLFDAATIERLAWWPPYGRVLDPAWWPRPTSPPVFRLSPPTRARGAGGPGARATGRFAAGPRRSCTRAPRRAGGAHAPNAVALTFGDESVTYAELDARANRLAHRLVPRWGARPDAPVGLCAGASAETIVGIHWGSSRPARATFRSTPPIPPSASPSCSKRRQPRWC